MDLIIWRHADVERSGRGEKRRLTAKGRKQAKRLAARLRSKLLSEVPVLTNPAPPRSGNRRRVQRPLLDGS
ncbi:MAG TPA: hypothetical protein VEL09_03065 [Burkholderiales bacterium]|nr:hypothetical protein [Burkholderiales bacterium]